MLVDAVVSVSVADSQNGVATTPNQTIRVTNVATYSPTSMTVASKR